MKKYFLAFVFVIFSFIGCKEKTYKAGTYVGVGTGNSGDIKVQVVIASNHKITDITVLEYSDTPGISDNVFAALPPAIIAQNNTDVDVISGATKTSKGLLVAVNNALEKALNY